MIYAFTHITNTADWDSRKHCYINPPKIKGRTLKGMIRWLKANNHTDWWLWCDRDEFIGWIDYDFARYIFATGEKFPHPSKVEKWLASNNE